SIPHIDNIDARAFRAFLMTLIEVDDWKNQPGNGGRSGMPQSGWICYAAVLDGKLRSAEVTRSSDAGTSPAMRPLRVFNRAPNGGTSMSALKTLADHFREGQWP